MQYQQESNVTAYNPSSVNGSQSELVEYQQGAGIQDQQQTQYQQPGQFQQYGQQEEACGQTSTHGIQEQTAAKVETAPKGNEQHIAAVDH